MKDHHGLGPQALRTIADLWQVDGPRSRWRDDGFDWWPGDFRVSVSALRRLDEFGPETWQLTVRTDFLKDAPINEPDFAGRVALLCKLPSPYATVYPTREFWEQYGPPGALPQLYFSNTAYVTQENVDWLPNFLGQMAIMQPINAQLRSSTTAPIFPGCSPDRSRPQALANAGLDPMLEVAHVVYAPAGRDANRWFGAHEFSELTEGWNRSEYCFGVADERGLVLETSFGDDTALIKLSTDERCIQLGSGLLATLQIPHLSDPRTIADECTAFNFREIFWTDIPQFGCWHPHSFGDERECPAFTMFIPNALYGPGVASQVVYWMLQRARALRQEHWPHSPDKPMPEILEARLTGK